MSHMVRNITNGPVALDGGRVLAPGEDADVEPNDHDKALENEGKLLRLHPTPKKKDGEK